MTQPTALPARIADHTDGCACSRCKGLEACPSCGRQKLDIDWCWHEHRLVFQLPQARGAWRPYAAKCAGVLL